MKSLKISFVFNILIFILVVVATICMVFGINFMSDYGVLSSASFEVLKYFTVDSNLFIGIVALILGIYEYLVIIGKSKRVPNIIYVLKFVSTVSVALTFVVTTFYLAPTSVYGYFSLFQNSNLFYHLVVPLLSMISLIFFENINFKFGYTFIGLVPALIYGTFYTYWVLAHVDNGMVLPEYDWYGFLSGGVETTLFVILIMLFINYLICFILWKLSFRKKH